MKNVENQFKDQGFVRIHKSYIVSVKKIDAVFGNTVEENGKQLPVGRSYKDEVSRILGMTE
jgi:DNA-binding LytR/AlgR family response regulator